MEVTHREKTEEEKKVIEEVRKTGKQWMGETSMDEVEKPEPEGERVNLKINQIPAITFLEGNLPRTMLDELNAHVDEHRETIYRCFIESICATLHRYLTSIRF